MVQWHHTLGAHRQPPAQLLLLRCVLPLPPAVAHSCWWGGGQRWRLRLGLLLLSVLLLLLVVVLLCLPLLLLPLCPLLLLLL